MDLSVIIPCYNEERSILPLYNHVKEVLDTLSASHEIIFVDDGSTDRTLEQMQFAKQQDPKVKILQLKRNYGQSSAFDAGFRNATGEIVFTMDGDLQNDPEDFPRLINKLHSGYDMVSGWRKRRKDTFGKILFSRIARVLRTLLVKDVVHDSGCALKAYRKETLAHIELFGEMHRYIPAILQHAGFKVGEIKVRHHKRKFGVTKYGWKRVVKGFLDLLYLKFWMDYATRPLHFFGSLGILQIGLGVLILLYKVIQSIILIYQGVVVFASPLLILGTLLIILGMLFIFFGFITEILVRTYFKTGHERPYIIGNIY